MNEKEAKQQPGLRERASIIFSLRHWTPYLNGKELTLRTNRKPNLAIARGKKQVYDWLTDEIMSYLPFKLEYLKGKNMFADVLSRPLGFSAAIEPSAKSIPEILKIAHDNAGHLSTRYTLQNIENLFNWPTMPTEVENYVCLFVCLFLFWAIQIIHQYIFKIVIAPLVNRTIKGITRVQLGHWVGFVYANNDFGGEVSLFQFCTP